MPVDRHGEQYRVHALVGEHVSHVDEFLGLFTGNQLLQPRLGAFAGLLFDVAQRRHPIAGHARQKPQERRAARAEPYDTDIDFIVGADHARGRSSEHRTLKECPSRDSRHLYSFPYSQSHTHLSSDQQSQRHKHHADETPNQHSA